MSLQVIFDTVHSDLSGQVEEICLKILEQMQRCEIDQLERVTYPIIASWTELKPSDKMLHSAVRALTHLRHSPLEMYFVFLDIEDDIEIALPVEEIAEALREEYFVHPRTGNHISNFENLLIPVFRASEEYVKGAEGGR